MAKCERVIITSTATASVAGNQANQAEYDPQSDDH